MEIALYITFYNVKRRDFGAGTYIIVITSRKEVGNFLGFPVYRVTSMKFLSCNEALKQSNSQEVSFFFFWPLEFNARVCASVSKTLLLCVWQKKDEAYFLTLLKTVESTPGLYYSYETDITLKYILIPTFYVTKCCLSNCQCYWNGP